MKMGTIASPCPYNVTVRHALQSAGLRRPAILHHASRGGRVKPELARERDTDMRQMLLFAAVALILQVTPTEARDAMTLVVGFAPGGTSSVAARFIAHAIEEFFDTSVVIENKPG